MRYGYQLMNNWTEAKAQPAENLKQEALMCINQPKKRLLDHNYSVKNVSREVGVVGIMSLLSTDLKKKKKKLQCGKEGAELLIIY